MKNDLVFDRDNKRFNFRSVGLLIHDNKVLLHQINNNPYWSLPGGRVEFGEPSSDSIIREIKEELEVDSKIIRPLWVIENFFHSFGRDTHEIAFYFLLTVPESLLNRGQSFIQMEHTSTLHFEWHKIDTLQNVILNPAFLRTAIKDLPQTLTYIINKDKA